MIGSLGIYHDHKPRVSLRPITWLSLDLRDHHLRARFDRLMRRWIRRSP